MRTPLAVIKAHAELLLHEPEHTVEMESARIATIIKETSRVSKLVEKLLLLARADSNQTEFEYKPVALDTLAGRMVEQFAPIAALKDITLDLLVGNKVELVGDKEQLAQLLVILLDNAVKYTGPGGAVVVQLNRKHNSAELVVRDSGCGVAPSDLPHIFDRFYRADKARSGKSRGTGLGLAIARWIVEKHGGIIKAESVAGEGTTMTVTLPVKRHFFS